MYGLVGILVNSCVFWYITPCILLEVNGFRFQKVEPFIPTAVGTSNHEYVSISKISE
jgi:hypothetical protein